MNYRDLEIWNLANDLVIDIHIMTLNKIPKFEMYEEGGQIRRSIKSVKSNIVEGFGRQKYKKEFIKFIIYALASNDETIDHLINLYRTRSLIDCDLYESLNERLSLLGKKLNKFSQAIENSHMSVK